MRYVFLMKGEPGETGCRGGVGTANLDDSEYAIEVGCGLRCDPRMLAFCAHMDEIEEILLHNTTSKLTDMVMQSWWTTERELQKQLKDSGDFPAIEPKRPYQNDEVCP